MFEAGEINHEGHEGHEEFAEAPARQENGGLILPLVFTSMAS
jgi:hypothetical protein